LAAPLGASGGDGGPAEGFAAGKVAANLRTDLIDRAQPGGGVEGNAGAIAPLIHATNPFMDGHILLGDLVSLGVQFHDQVAANATARAGGEVVEGVRHGPKDDA